MSDSRIPLLDLKAQYATIRREIERAVARVFEEQSFILGPVVERFEREMEAYTGAAHAIGVASGSDALLLALMALGVGPNDTVVTTPFSFFATAGAPARVGARIVFADIEADTFNLSARTVEQALDGYAQDGGKLVFLPVHLFGRLVERELFDLARSRRALLIEDACQAIGARREGRMAGTFGDIGAYSFFPSKNLGGAGDGGMVVASDPEVANRLRTLRTHGSARRYHHDVVGINSRLDALQAAILSVKLERLEEWNSRRRDRAALYHRSFRSHGLDGGPIHAPSECGEEHVFHQYVMRAERRDELRAVLSEAGIESQVYYPVALHRQPCFADLGWREGDLPETERAVREALALPIYPELRDDQIERVVSTIARFYG